MNNRKEISQKNIELRKNLLQAEIDRIETKYSDQAAKIETGVKKALQPMKEIRNNPFKAVGVSIGVGFLVGFLTGGSSKNNSSKNNSSSTGYGAGFTSLFMSELKRVAAHRAMLYLSEMVDKKVIPKFKEKLDSTQERVYDPKDRF